MPLEEVARKLRQITEAHELVVQRRKNGNLFRINAHKKVAHDKRPLLYENEKYFYNYFAESFFDSPASVSIISTLVTGVSEAALLVAFFERRVRVFFTSFSFNIFSL